MAMSLRTIGIAGGILGIVLLVAAIFVATHYVTYTDVSDRYGCFFQEGRETFAITNEEEYRALEKSDFSGCVDVMLPEIDFSKHFLIARQITSGGCSVTFFPFVAVLPFSDNELLFHTHAWTKGSCDLAAIGRIWVQVPATYSGHEIIYSPPATSLGPRKEEVAIGDTFPGYFEANPYGPWPSVSEADPFRGAWEMRRDGTWDPIAGHVDRPRSFVLRIVTDGDRLLATHAATVRGGAQVDGSKDDTVSMAGTIQGMSAEVEYRSSFAEGIGKANVTLLNDGTLQFKTVSRPEGDPGIIPDEALLVRDTMYGLRVGSSIVAPDIGSSDWSISLKSVQNTRGEDIAHASIRAGDTLVDADFSRTHPDEVLVAGGRTYRFRFCTMYPETEGEGAYFSIVADREPVCLIP